MYFPFGDIPDDSPKLSAWKLVHDEMLPILGLYKDPTVTDIFVDRFDRVSVMRGGELQTTVHCFDTEDVLWSFINQVATTLDQDRFDINAPILDARLPDGSRVNAVHESYSPQGSTISLRKVPQRLLTQDDFLNSGMFTDEILDYMKAMIADNKTFGISGNMGSGKTSLLRFLSEFVDKRTRLITAEDTQELHINTHFPFGIALEAAQRKGSIITLPILIQATMRQQPDRVWVGELRTAAAVDALLQIVYSGVRGCAFTFHGKSVKHGLSRLQYLLASSGNVSYELTGVLLRDSIDVIIQTHRDPVWGRRITEIGELINGEPRIVFKFDTEAGKHVRVD
ncbi:CpaF family protein [Salmonella enterica]|nr:CpaF family protein [Klebsiella pneumoniae]ELE4368153.1 CpaF family protein [Salmonella enterica]EMD7130162.1 CpaF family protein [Salmonella enterica]